MERFSSASVEVAPRRSLDYLGMDLSWDNEDDGASCPAGSTLSPGRGCFFFSAPTSPRAYQAVIQNDNLDLSYVPESRFEVNRDGRHKRDEVEEEFEFEFSSSVLESVEPPFSPTIIFTSSSRMLLPPPPLPPLLKTPPHLRKPHSLSVQEPSLASEKPDAIEVAAQQAQEKPCKAKSKWRLKDFLSQSNGQKRPPIPHSWPHGQRQGSMSSSTSSCSSSSSFSSSSSGSGRKVMYGTAMGMKASSPSYPLPSPGTPRSSQPSSTRKIANPSPHELLYRSKRAQLRDRQKKTSLPYRPSFLGCLGFASNCYVPITEFSRGLQSVK